MKDLPENVEAKAGAAVSPINLADVRTDYRRGQLRREELAADPIDQFRLWLDEATRAGVIEPTAMSLATTGSDLRPRVRTVLLKGLDERGFVFFTNFTSRKGGQLQENPAASLLFPWLALERQVIVSGQVGRTSDEEARAYFASRPPASQLAAWASAQSQVITSRAVLEEALDRVKEKFGAEPAPLPPFWGGYRVVPETIEFWQGRASRLHDRFEYRRLPDSGATATWTLERLAP